MKKKTLSISAIAVSITLFASLILLVFWGKGQFSEQAEYIPIETGGSLVLTGLEGDQTEEKSEKIALTSVKLLSEEYATYGVSAQAESAYTITATVYPDDSGTNTWLDWTVSFADETSEWATGKTVTDYVTVTPIGSSLELSKKVTVSCYGAFGEQILVTAASQDNPEITATITVDYVQKLGAFYLSFGDVECNFDGETEVTVEVGDGTPSGGAADTAFVASGVASMEDEFSVTYTVENVSAGTSGGFLGYFLAPESDYSRVYNRYWLAFANDTGVLNESDPSCSMASSAIAETGLYFSFDYFQTKMGLKEASYKYAEANATVSDFSYTAEELMSRYNSCLSTQMAGGYDDGYVRRYEANFDIFKLTVEVQGKYSGESHTYSTTFVMKDYSNTVEINSIGTDSSELYF